MTVYWNLADAGAALAWVKSVLTERERAAEEPSAANAPSWLRYCVGNKPALSRASVEIVDGLISYVWQNHPVLAVGDTYLEEKIRD